MMRLWVVLSLIPRNHDANSRVCLTVIIVSYIEDVETVCQTVSATTSAGCKFCLTGGITEATAPDWLALESVLCVGGSWVTDGL